jgi:pyridoxine kinase
MILSIQSHVAYGRVGNRSAVFPLELIGQDVIAVNTVQFSNHTGYPSWRGQVFGADHVRDVIQGIDETVGLDCAAVLSGYMGDIGTGAVILDAVDRVRSVHPDAIYCLDPVMGDVRQGFFVKAGIPEFIRDEAVRRATIVTPNQFEAEYLAGMKILSIADARTACGKIRTLGPSIILVTSFLPEDTDDDGKTCGKISMYLSTVDGDWIITTDRLSFARDPNGAGDLTSALFLGRYLETRDPTRALELMANSVFAVFERTRDAKSRELQLVASRFDIMNPEIRFTARIV